MPSNSFVFVIACFSFSEKQDPNKTGQLACYLNRTISVLLTDQVRLLLDGMTCANDLGLTHAVPAQVSVLTDARLRSIKINNLIITFKLTAPSKLYWAQRPAMRIVQSLYWLKDTLNDENWLTILKKLSDLLAHSNQKHEIYADLVEGLHTLPVWMQKWIKEFLLTLEK